MKPLSIRSVILAGVLAVALAPDTPMAQSDAVLSEAVAERILANWGDQPSGIIVQVNEGVVELWGQAPSQELAEDAVQIARSTSGVRQVVSHLDVWEPATASATGRTGRQQQAGNRQQARNGQPQQTAAAE